MPKTWRCAIIGTGVVGEWHVRLLPKMPNCKLVAVCDIEPGKAADVLSRNKLSGIPEYSNLRDMLAKEQFDSLHVCTPSGTHMEVALPAIEAGKNIVCEKPMEIQTDRIDAMAAAAKKYNVRLAGIFQNRWSDANRFIKQAADEGRFGRIAWAGCFTPWYRPDKYYEDGGWRGTWKVDGGGAIMNQSVHAVDLLQWIAGPVQQVSAYSASRIHSKIEVEDTLSCSLQFANGAFGTIVGTTAMFPGRPVRIEIGGENGTAVAENGLTTFKFREERPGDAEAIASTAPKSNVGGASSARDLALDRHMRNFNAIYEAWDQGRDAETFGPEARKAVAIILAMYESARNNGASVKVR
jgi:predicted dehydrogenase